MANTIADKLTYLSGTKDAIKQAIIAKGVEVTDTDTFRSYANKIEAIQAGGGGSIAGAPSGITFSNSTFTTVPTEIFPYLEAQTDLSGIFRSCQSLETVQLFDTSRATTMQGMFDNCTSLTSIPQFNTVNVINLSSMFGNCTSLQTIPQFNTVNVINLSFMFGFCSNLQTIPQLNTSSVNNIDFIFRGCSSLTNLGGFTGLKLDLDLTESPLLTVDSIMNVITAAADMTSEPKALILHKKVFNKLTEEQIATATAKGWEIASV